jgi:succinate-acetate transporter protein
MSENKLGNPAVIGLAGFGMTTFILQFHNLGWCGIAPVIWLGLIFGGGAQFLAGLMEFKKGNNFGFCAFVGFGSFWVSLVLMLVFGENSALAQAYPVLAFNATDLGFFLGTWGAFTFFLFLAAMRKNTVSALIFLTLTLGFVGLTISEFSGMKLCKTVAAWDLILCASLAWYEMIVIYMAEAGVKLPLGPAWLGNK